MEERRGERKGRKRGRMERKGRWRERGVRGRGGEKGMGRRRDRRGREEKVRGEDQEKFYPLKINFVEIRILSKHYDEPIKAFMKQEGLPCKQGLRA